MAAQLSTPAHAALYYPWIKVRIGDKVGEPIPPSGHIAGLFAQCDKREGVHRAAANVKLEGIVDVATRLKKRERDHLFDKQINTLVPFPGRGLRTWGARTLSSDSSWKQINVRRIFILVRKSIEIYAQWVVFEPNEPGLWKKLTRSIDVFLADLWTDGALLGASKAEAFYVKCDEETNPPESRDVGQLIVEIGISPVRPGRVTSWCASTSGRANGPTPTRETGRRRGEIGPEAQRGVKRRMAAAEA